MAPNFTLKRKYSGTTESTPNEIELVANADNSPNKRMRIECLVNDEETNLSTSTRGSSLVQDDIDEEEENEVLTILIPGDDEDSTEKDEVESDGEREAETSDSEESQSCRAPLQNRGEDRDNDAEQTETLESGFSAPQRPQNEFYCGSGTSPSRSLSPPSIFLPPQAEPCNLSNPPQAQEEEDPQPVSQTIPSPIWSNFIPPQPTSPQASIFDALRALRRKYHPSPKSDRSTSSLNAHDSEEVLDETEDTNGEDGVDLDLIWAMFNGTPSTAAGETETDHQSEYPVYIEEMNLPGLEDTLTSVAAGDNTAGLETHKVWWEHEDGHLSEEPPPLRPEIEEDEDEEDPEARLRRLVREGEMASEDGT